MLQQRAVRDGFERGRLVRRDASSWGQYGGLRALLFYDTEHIGKSALEWEWGILTLIFRSFFCCVLVFRFVLVCHILVVTGSYLHL